MDKKEEIFLHFGQRVTELRRQKGLSIGTLAAFAGITEEELFRIECGQVDVLFTTIVALASGLGVEPAQLLETLPD